MTVWDCMVGGVLVGYLLALVALWFDNRVTGRVPWPWSSGKGQRRKRG